MLLTREADFILKLLFVITSHACCSPLEASLSILRVQTETSPDSPPFKSYCNNATFISGIKILHSMSGIVASCCLNKRLSRLYLMLYFIAYFTLYYYFIICFTNCVTQISPVLFKPLFTRAHPCSSG